MISTGENTSEFYFMVWQAIDDSKEDLWFLSEDKWKSSMTSKLEGIKLDSDSEASIQSSTINGDFKEKLDQKSLSQAAWSHYN